MCGIAGSFGFDDKPYTQRSVLEAMGQALTHRGPDEHDCGW